MAFKLRTTVEERYEEILERTLYCAAVEVYKDNEYYMTIRSTVYCLDAASAWLQAEAIKEEAEDGFNVKGVEYV